MLGSKGHARVGTQLPLLTCFRYLLVDTFYNRAEPALAGAPINHTGTCGHRLWGSPGQHRAALPFVPSGCMSLQQTAWSLPSSPRVSHFL